MTITISGATAITTTPYVTTGISYSPFTGLYESGITDTASQTVTVTVTQRSILHSNPGATIDQTTVVQGPALIAASASSNAPATNPPVVNGDQFTTTGPTTVTTGTYNYQTNTFSPVAYSVNRQLGTLRAAPPTIALIGSQLLETDFTITATDQVGGSASQVVKYLFTNPIKIGQGGVVSTYLHSDINPLSGLGVQNDNNRPFYTSGTTAASNFSGTTTIKITQSTILHTDPSLPGGDSKGLMLPGTFSFKPTGGDATNAPVIDQQTGSVTLSGSLTAPTTGTADPIDYPSGYAPHEYSPGFEMSSLKFTPSSSQPLSGKEYLETTFTITAIDSVTGSNATTTVTERFANPISLLSTTAPSAVRVNYGATVAPLANNLVVSATGTAIESISQTSFIHTDPGAADDQKIAVGPGVFSGTQANVLVTATPAGLTTVSGAVGDVNLLIGRLNFAPPAVTLTGNQTLETDFTVYAGDGYGDFVSYSRVLTEVSPQAANSTSTNGTTSTSTSPNTINPPSTISTTSAPNTMAPITTASVFRFFDTNTGTHFFTSSSDERNTLLASRPDLVQETNGFGAVDATSPNAVAVFRFFDKIHGTQFITSDAGERDSVRASRPDLSYEDGNVFYEHTTQQTGDVSIFRFFDSKLGTHFYTGNQSESAAISTPGSAGFRADLVSEGIAFYAPSGTFK